jgi:hypothetical protein
VKLSNTPRGKKERVQLTTEARLCREIEGVLELPGKIGHVSIQGALYAARVEHRFVKIGGSLPATLL